MQSTLLMLMSATLAHAKIADTIFDALTFPNAHRFLYRQNRYRTQRDSGISVGSLPGYPTQHLELISPLTNSTLPINGLHRSYQPLYFACFTDIVNNTLNMHLTQNEQATYNCMGDAIRNMSHDALRLFLNLTSANRASIRVIGADNTTYMFVCSEHLNISTAMANSTFYSANKQLYCFTNETYLGPLPANLSDITIYRTGQFYVNGYLLGTLPISVKTVRIETGGLPAHSTYFALANLTDTLITLANTTITQVTYCESSTIDNIACQRSTHTLADGFYSAQQDLFQSNVRTVITLPKLQEVEVIQVNITATFNFGEPKVTAITINGNDSYCVTKPYFTIQSNFVCTGCTLQVRSSTCNFDLFAINNGMSFSQFCISATAGSCSSKIVATYVWNYDTGRNLYFTFTEGQMFTGTSTTTPNAIDTSSIIEGVCTDYTIYGISGTGIIKSSDLQLHNGIAFTSPTGGLYAFKNVTTGQAYQVLPCVRTTQAVVINNTIVGVITSTNTTLYGFQRVIPTPTFYYTTNATNNCTQPILSYGPLAVCSDGSISATTTLQDTRPSIVSLYNGEIDVPSAFALTVQSEYLQIQSEQVVIDCAQYVCNGNPRCLRLLSQYTSACSNIESALHASAQLDSRDITDMFQTSTQSLELANITNFQGDYNFTNILSNKIGEKSVIEDLLFNKVVTNGLGTVDQDYKACSKDMAIADLVCSQYYNGIMVLPGVVDAEKMAMYTGSLTGAMVFGGLTAAAAIPFSTGVQARLNYVALQTNVLQENQKILADSFNQAVGNISLALSSVNDAIQQTSEALNTVANAINKIQTVVNQQGEALSHLTAQLSNNFQAISTSIQDIYNRLEEVEANQQVDRLITGRLSALNAYVTQLLNQMSQIRQYRLLAQQKINECVKSQSTRYGFCGNGTHLFSLTQAAPNGILFMHAVLVPTKFARVTASAGICVDSTKGYSLQPQLVLFNINGTWRVTPRNMYEPRIPRSADFVPLTECSVTYYNTTASQLPTIVPDFVDVNQTVSDIIGSLPNPTPPSLVVDFYNHTILNLSAEILDLQQRADNLSQISEQLQHYIDNLNNTLVDLEWLNKVETYIKWPWWVWLLIVLAIAAFACILVTIFLCTGCCGGCFGCCGGCFGLFSHKKRDTEPTPITSFKLKEW
ncbi:spike glycoprotein [Munia coronavirus HKU13-3514]|uniref:Spike glycoprotein n=1 Tax=Munia coronavirus HKU13 TaxID=1297661 RepID=B6VDY7_9NIDO|nr:spike glycoprotein [Munia coronavirus HKU13-3514]ACJ12062.1 spike glycoprotein [Munia coronavirus HKU13-3514]